MDAATTRALLNSRREPTAGFRDPLSGAESGEKCALQTRPAERVSRNREAGGLAREQTSRPLACVDRPAVPPAMQLPGGDLSSKPRSARFEEKPGHVLLGRLQIAAGEVRAGVYRQGRGSGGDAFLRIVRDPLNRPLVRANVAGRRNPTGPVDGHQQRKTRIEIDGLRVELISEGN